MSVRFVCKWPGWFHVMWWVAFTGALIAARRYGWDFGTGLAVGMFLGWVIGVYSTLRES